MHYIVTIICITYLQNRFNEYLLIIEYEYVLHTLFLDTSTASKTNLSPMATSGKLNIVVILIDWYMYMWLSLSHNKLGLFENKHF